MIVTADDRLRSDHFEIRGTLESTKRIQVWIAVTRNIAAVVILDQLVDERATLTCLFCVPLNVDHARLTEHGGNAGNLDQLVRAGSHVVPMLFWIEVNHAFP